MACLFEHETKFFVTAKKTRTFYFLLNISSHHSVDTYCHSAFITTFKHVWRHSKEIDVPPAVTLPAAARTEIGLNFFALTLHPITAAPETETLDMSPRRTCSTSH